MVSGVVGRAGLLRVAAVSSAAFLQEALKQLSSVRNTVFLIILAELNFGCSTRSRLLPLTALLLKGLLDTE